MLPPKVNTQIQLPKDTSFKEALRYYIQLFFFKKRVLALIGILLFILVALQFAEPYLYKLIINELEFNLGNQNVAGNIITIAGIWLGVSLLMNILQVGRTIIIWRYMHQVWRKAWSAITEKLFHMDISYHMNEKGGSTLKKSDDYQQAFFMLGETMLQTLSLAVCSFSVGLIVVFTLDWRMALVSLGTLPFFVFSCFVVERRTSMRQDRVEKQWSKLFGVIGDSFGNIMSILSFGQEKRFIATIEETTSHTQKLQENINTWWAMVDQAQEFSAGIARLLVIGVGAYFVTQGTLTIGDIAMFIGYVTFLYAPIGVISSNIKRYQQWWKQYLRGVNILTKNSSVESGELTLDNPKGHISIKNISFRYDDHDKHSHIIDHMSFDITPGETVALVGHSGAGKTTLTHLLEHFYDPTDGAIYFDGIEYKTLSLESLRNHLAIVFQENTMFHESILMNVKLGKPDASQEEVEEACRQAAIHDFISHLPKGYETKVGERGVKLSGGQRQRLAIARAILKNPAFIILDEATSALDSKTEQEVQEAIKNLTKNKSTLIIAHRLSTIIHADKILYLEHGKIVDMGPHKELLERCAGYQELVKLQANGLLAE